MKHALLLTILACCGMYVSAADRTDSVRIHFRQSFSQLDTAYKDNAANLARMLTVINKSVTGDSTMELSEVKVIGAASPEGSIAINRRLSEKRAKKIFDYFAQRTSLPDSITSFTFIGRDWAGLLNLVRNDDKVPFRVDVINLLEEISSSVDVSGKDTEENLRKLKKLHRGVPYIYMYNNLFPTLRASKLAVTYHSCPVKPFIDPEIVEEITEIDSIIPPVITPCDTLTYFTPICDVCHPFYMGLKTNLLYDALALPSVGVEFYIGKGWSVIADWTYGWWDNDSKHRYWRAYGGDLGVRKWFGKAAENKPLTGHHLGLYAGVGTYDFEFGGKGYMGGLPGRSLWDRCNFMGGIEYGYSLPIARRLNLDFTIGIGYLGGKVIEYVPKGNVYVWESTKTLHWFGPTKAEISLVWLIGCDNYNRKKGGNL